MIDHMKRFGFSGVGVSLLCVAANGNWNYWRRSNRNADSPDGTLTPE